MGPLVAKIKGPAKNKILLLKVVVDCRKTILLKWFGMRSRMPNQMRNVVNSLKPKNDIDSLIYSTEKSLLDNGDKLDEDIKKDIEKAISEAKEVKDGEDLEIISTKKEALSQASMKIGEAIYKAQQ